MYRGAGRRPKQETCLGGQGRRQGLGKERRRVGGLSESRGPDVGSGPEGKNGKTYEGSTLVSLIVIIILIIISKERSLVLLRHTRPSRARTTHLPYRRVPRPAPGPALRRDGTGCRSTVTTVFRDLKGQG